MNALRNLMLTLGLVVAVVPGMSPFLAQGLVPPGEGLLFAVSFELAGSLTLLATWLARKRIGRMAKARATRSSIASAAIGLIGLFGFRQIHQYCSIPSDAGEKFWLPIVPAGPLDQLIRDTPGGRFSIVVEWGDLDVYEHLLNEPAWNMVVTNAVLLMLGACFVVGTCLAFSVLGIRVLADDPSAGATPDRAPKP